MRFELEAEDARLIGEEVGQGPVFVLLHAGAERRKVWEPVEEALVAAGYACVTLDQRGHGESSGARVSFDRFADDAAQLCDRLAGRAVCVGASLGGLSLLAMNGVEPAATERRIAGLVLVDVVPDPNPDATNVLLTRLLGPATASSPLVLDILSRAEALRDAARTLALPALLIRGEHGISDEDATRFSALVPHALHTTIAGASHLVARDRPHALADALIAFGARDTVKARWSALRRSEPHARAQAWLELHAAGAIEHLAGTLRSHLRRTALWLERWQAHEHVQLAGLCHAAYGTDGFATALSDDRQALCTAIGARAEQLVYDYCACDRQYFYAQLGAPQLRLRDRMRGDVRALLPAELDALVLLTLANELDVALHTTDSALRAAITGLVRQLHTYRPAEATLALRVLEQRER